MNSCRIETMNPTEMRYLSQTINKLSLLKGKHCIRSTNIQLQITPETCAIEQLRRRWIEKKKEI